MSPILSRLGRFALLALLVSSAVGLAQPGVAPAPTGTQTETQTGPQTADQPESAAAPDPDTVVARLGDRTETLASLQERFEIAIRSLVAGQGMEMTDALRAQLLPFLPQYLEQRASEIVLLAEAARRGFEADEAQVDGVVANIEGNVPEGSTLEAQLQDAGFASDEQLRTLVRESNLINQVLTAIQDEVVLTDDQVKLAYQSRKADFARPEMVCASHILLETEPEAQTVLADLQAGADFAEEAEAESTDPSAANNGGDLGCFERTRMVEPFAEAAFAAPLDTVVGPVESQFGYHLILVRQHDPASVRPLAEVRDQVEVQARQDRANGVVQALVRSSGVQTFPDRLPPPPPPPSAEQGPEDLR